MGTVVMLLYENSCPTSPGVQRSLAISSNLRRILSEGAQEQSSLPAQTRCDLIAFSMSPPRTCRPGQNADKESTMLYCASPWKNTVVDLGGAQETRLLTVWTLTLRYCCSHKRRQLRARRTTYPVTVR